MRSNYVRGASLSSSAFQAEIQQMLAGCGAREFRIASEHGKATVSFSLGDRRFRFVLSHLGSRESSSSQETARQGWRQLSVLIRAKLEAVASGIVTFDEEFLAYMVMPGGATVFQASAPAITNAYASHGTALSSKEARDE